MVTLWLQRWHLTRSGVGANADGGPFFSVGGVYLKYQIYLPNGLINNASPSPSRSRYSALACDFNGLDMFLHHVFLRYGIVVQNKHR